MSEQAICKHCGTTIVRTGSTPTGWKHAVYKGPGHTQTQNAEPKAGSRVKM